MTNAHITWQGIRCMKWFSLIETVNSLTKDSGPDIIVIHLASNVTPLPHVQIITNRCLFMEKFANTSLIFSEVLSKRFWDRNDGRGEENAY